MNHFLDNQEIEQVSKYLYTKDVESEEVLSLLKTLHSLYSEYEYFYPKRYKPAFERKIKFFEPILKGESFLKIDPSNVDLEDYSYVIFEEIIKRLENIENLFWKVENEKEFKERFEDETEQKKRMLDEKIFFLGKELAIYLKKNLSKEEILSNRIKRDYRVGFKRFGAGGKVTKLLSAISDIYNLWSIKDHYIGNMVADEKIETVFLSTHPFTGYLAGMISDSCLSPEGCNLHAGIQYNGYKNSALFHNQSLTWRAFVSFDFENKYFKISKGYPRENYTLQFLLKRYFENLGFSLVDNYFAYPSYWDNQSLFDGKRMQGENTDAFHNYELEETITGTTRDNTIAPSFYSDYFDSHSFDPDHEGATDGYLWSEYEGTEYYEDNVYWSEFLESYISDNGESWFITQNEERITQHYYNTISQILGEECVEKAKEYDFDLDGFAYDLLRETDDYVSYQFAGLLAVIDHTYREVDRKNLADYFFNNLNKRDFY